MHIQRADKATLANWVRDTLAKNPPPDAFWLPLLFAGERLLAAEDVFVVREGKTIVGAVTLSMQGEVGEGPEIIGLYVLPSYRGRGVGSLLFRHAYDALKAKGADTIRVVILSSAARRLADRLNLPDLEVRDVGIA